MQVNETDCYIDEGCLNRYGPRELVHTTHIKNIGDGYYIGVPWRTTSLVVRRTDTGTQRVREVRFV